MKFVQGEHPTYFVVRKAKYNADSMVFEYVRGKARSRLTLDDKHEMVGASFIDLIHCYKQLGREITINLITDIEEIEC